MEGRKIELNTPVKADEEVEVKIIAVGEKGDGIAKVDGYTIFVSNAKEGETVKIKIKRCLPNFAFAEVVPGGAKEEQAEQGEEKKEPSEGED